jgi:hypothetical protein
MALKNYQLTQKIQDLPPEMQQEVIDFVDFLETKLQRKTQAESTSQLASVYDLISNIGGLGSIEGPADLSINKAYLDGFGESHHASSHS